MDFTQAPTTARPVVQHATVVVRGFLGLEIDFPDNAAVSTAYLAALPRQLHRAVVEYGDGLRGRDPRLRILLNVVAEMGWTTKHLSQSEHSTTIVLVLAA